jgi:hypothetical protein
MKRSTKDTIYVSPGDFDLVLRKHKTATSRLGNKSDMYDVNQKVNITENVEPDRSVKAVITNVIMTPLKHVTTCEAYKIGRYSIVEHAIDFTNIYASLGNNITPDTLLTIIEFAIKE